MNTKQEILQELNEMESPLATMPREMPYAVPDGYFAGLSDAVHAGVRRADEEASVPAYYFQNLPQAMLAAAKAADAKADVSKPRTRIISLPPARRWAAAAVLLMAFGIGGALLFNAQPSSNPETALAALPQEDLAEYAAANIDTSGAFPTDGALVSADAAEAHGLSNLTETEVEAYLSEEGVLF